MTQPRTIQIVEADTDRGVPNVAECPCGARWLRPLGDMHAATLTRWAREHECAMQQELFPS